MPYVVGFWKEGTGSVLNLQENTAKKCSEMIAWQQRGHFNCQWKILSKDEVREGVLNGSITQSPFTHEAWTEFKDGIGA